MESLKATADRATAWFICEIDDIEERTTAAAHGAEVLYHPDAHTYAEKVNLGYRHTSAPWLLVVGDDVVFHDDWQSEVLATAEAENACVISTNDLCNPYVLDGTAATHPLIRRSYIDELGTSWEGPGTVCFEGYRHVGPEEEMVAIARQRGVFAACMTSIIEHMHPVAGKGAMDAGYELGMSTSQQDNALFVKRCQEHHVSAHGGWGRQ